MNKNIKNVACFSKNLDKCSSSSLFSLLNEIKRFEADNRKVSNRYQDLEFQLEEAQIRNEFLSKSNIYQPLSDDETTNDIDIIELKQSLISLRREKSDEEERLNLVDRHFYP